MVPSGRLETLILQSLAFQSLRAPDFVFGARGACTADPNNDKASTEQNERTTRRQALGSFMRSPLATLLAAEGGGNNSRNRDALRTKVDKKDPNMLPDVVSMKQSHHYSDVLSSVQCPSLTTPTGHIHSIYSDIANINLSSVLPQQEVLRLTNHADEVCVNCV